MRDDNLIDVLPDLILHLRRDGSVVTQAGGRLLSEFHLEAEWPQEFRILLRKLTRHAIATRGNVEGTVATPRGRYEIRVTAQSPERAIGMVRALVSSARDEYDSVDDRLDARRDFWQRLTESIATASLGERSLALAVIHLGGVADISQTLDATVSDRLIRMALRRVAARAVTDEDGMDWYAGQTGDEELTVLFKHARRDAIEQSLALICRSLSTPLELGDASFHLRAHAGVAILGQDAGSQKALMEGARAAATEARRCEAAEAHFYSDTLKVRALTRLDIAGELREALASGDIGLRYRGRHDLKSNRLAAVVSEVRWRHPIRGDISVAKLLAAAAATGFAATLSRALLDTFCRDAQAMLAGVGDDVRLSFAVSRHHAIEGTLTSDIKNAFDAHSLDASRLELRLPESLPTAREPTEWQLFAKRGLRIVIEEVGWKPFSIDALANTPIWGLQLDAACVAAASRDTPEGKVGRAVVSVARAMGLVPLAATVDTSARRRYLMSIGCEQGSGDYYDADNSGDTLDSASTNRQFSQRP